MTPRQSVPLAGLAFALFVLGVSVLAAIHRGESDFISVLSHGITSAILALFIGMALAYFGVHLFGNTKDSGKQNAGSQKSQGDQIQNSREGGAL